MASGVPQEPADQRWLALVFIALAQLMVALDATIVNVALPTVQRFLQLSDSDRGWVITAYTLPFAAFLLLGGRVADSVGRRRAFSIVVAAALAGILVTTPTAGRAA
jgi:MFS family permease